MENSSDKKSSNQSNRKRLVVVILIAAGLLLVIFFGMRTIRGFARLRQMDRRPLSTDVELIRGWMTVPYVSNNYRVPVEYLAKTCNLPPPEKHENLADINKKIAPDKKGLVVDCIKDAITTFQKTHPTPPAGPQ